MRVRAFVFAVVLAGIVAASPTIAQEWKTYSFVEDGYSIDLPGTPTEKTDTFDPSKVVRHREQRFDAAPQGYVVTATTYQPATGASAWGINELRGIAADRKGQCELRNELSAATAVVASYEVVFDKCPDGIVTRMQLHRIGDRLYQLVAAGQTGADQAPDTEKFFNSFKPVLPAPAPAVAAAPPPPAAPAGPASPTPAGKAASILSGLAAWNALVGNTITGRNDEGLLIEHYLPDGTVKSKTDDELSTGRWSMRGDRVCFKFAKEEEECYRLEVDGSAVTYIENGGKRWHYDILQGNPKRL